MRLGALGGFDPERRVAARAAAALEKIFALHLLGQSEEVFRLGFGVVDQPVRNAVVGDDREAIFLEAVPELLRKGVRVAVGVLETNGRNLVCVDRGHGILFTVMLNLFQHPFRHGLGGLRDGP